VFELLKREESLNEKPFHLLLRSSHRGLAMKNKKEEVKEQEQEEKKPKGRSEAR